MGGVSVVEIVTLNIGLATCSIRIGSIGILCSANSESPIGGVLTAYGGAVLYQALSMCLCGMMTNAVTPFSNPAILIFDAFATLAVWLVSCELSSQKIESSYQEKLKRPSLQLLRRRRENLPMSGFDNLMGFIEGRPSELPEDDPILWREQHLAWAQIRNNSMTIVGILLGEILIIWLLLFDSNFSRSLPVVALYFCVAAVFVICFRAVNVFASEFSQQTLDVLLTTPIDTATILKHKFFETRKFIRWFMLPLCTMLLHEIITIRTDPQGIVGVDAKNLGECWQSFALATATFLFVYPRLLMWLSLWAYFQLRNTVAAAIAILTLMWSSILLPEVFAHKWDSPIWLSPSTVFDTLFESGYRHALLSEQLIHFLAFTGLWLIISTVCKSRMDRLLGRLSVEKS
ncbi:MAG: hypothetical protein CMJ78_10970 [Planctomycetaceae bacterium]|nr:hypothetical protein [Planctomycetaceae bacterium]